MGGSFYKITMQARKLQILPSGYPATTIYGYNGITPGPTIVAQRGAPIVVRQINKLPNTAQFNYPTWTSVHLHGSASLPQYDGYASDVTNPGQYKDYHYPNIQDSRTLWYHDHGVHHTAENAYMGLAAQYHLHDSVEAGLPIPKSYGRYDIPLIIQDKIFDTNGQFVFDNNSFAGLYGDVILVNGKPWPVMKVERRKYRFRVLNASICRCYRLQLSSGQPFTFIGTDGGLMPEPQAVQGLPHRAGRALRDRHRLRPEQNRRQGRPAEHQPAQQHRLQLDTSDHALRRGLRGHRPLRQRGPRPAQPQPGGHGPAAVADGAAPRDGVCREQNGHWTVSGHDLGRRHQQQFRVVDRRSPSTLWRSGG